jgi:peptidoglycan/LPS O-acetylase OafA/YrhL
VSRIRSLDGWRAVGVTLVLVSHAPYTTGFPERYAAGLSAVFDGELGVRIFFVLSGFLITYLLLAEAERAGVISLRRFYARRALRILPIYVTYLVVLALLTALGLYQDSLSSWIGALTFTRNMVGQGQSATVQLWSLSVEEQFYVLWPTLLAAFVLWRRPRLVGAMTALVIVACPIIRATLVTPPGGTLIDRLFGARSGLMYADSLVIGCAGAFLVRRWRQVPAVYEARVLRVLAVAVIVGGRVLQYWPPAPWIVAAVPGAQAIAIMFLIWASAFHRPGLLSRALNLPPVARLGTLSYSIYVWQFLFVANFVPRLAGLWTHDWKWWMPCAVTVAALSYYGVERPFLQLKTRFAVAASPDRAASARL